MNVRMLQFKKKRGKERKKDQEHKEIMPTGNEKHCYQSITNLVRNASASEKGQAVLFIHAQVETTIRTDHKKAWI